MTTIKWFGQREETGEPDFYIYDEIPDELRGKIRFTVLDCLERVRGELANRYGVRAVEVVYEQCRQQLCRALGRDIGSSYHSEESLGTFLNDVALTDLLRGLEVLFLHLIHLTVSIPARDVAAEEMRLEEDLNKLFALYRVGYRVQSLDMPREDEPPVQITRTDSEFTHKEMVKPTLRALQQEGFEPAAQQFSEALHEYTTEHYDNAITDANSAFESVLKIVLNRKKGNAQELIREAQKQGYFPAYLENRIVHFAELLEALPVVRYQEGDAHGKVGISEDPERFARYAIHLAASNIIFIMDEYNRRKKAQ